MPRRNFNEFAIAAAAFALVFSGCGARKSEAPARPRASLEERLALEEQAEREAAAANRAITEMTNRAFRRRTPEEEALHQAEKAREVEALLKAQREADAKVTSSAKP